MHRFEMWPEIEKVFNEAVELDPPDRAKFLDKACCGNEELRRELESLLAQANKDGLLGNPALVAAAPMVSQVRTGSWRLSPGMRLGPYEITTAIGKGGMAEVYRARDTKLHRNAAIKVLPETFAQDRERIARFRREAQLLASLNHPRIAAVYGIEEHDGVCGLALEFVDGETLAERIARGRLPLDEALEFATQIAEALEAAHARGVVHRDLKPANIKITRDGTVKVLDFGLAKIFQPELSTANRPATVDFSTDLKVILGTAPYMSPEQARGKDVDKRTDIWGWGCVLYEMLTGRRAFDGDTTTEVIARIASEEPDWMMLPEDTPASIRRLLRRSLQKDAGRRIHDIADARIEIDESLQEPPATYTRKRALRWQYALIAIFGIAGALSGFVYFRREPITLPMVRLEISTPSVAPSFALSADGRLVAFVARAETRTMLWLRPLESASARQLPGTEGAIDPFWSPDGTSIGFFADGKLKTIDVASGAIRILAPAPMPAGGTWNRDGVILFAPEYYGPIFRVSTMGGEAIPVTALAVQKPPEPAPGHRFPEFLPDQRHFLYHCECSRHGNYVSSLDGNVSVQLNDSGSKAVYASSFLYFADRDRQLVAQRFDLKTLVLSGEPIPIAQNIDVVGTPGGRRAFAVAANGTIAYRTTSNVSSRLTWFDRSGNVMGTPSAQELNAINPELSPDGKTVAMSRLVDDYYNIWLLETVRGGMRRITSDANNYMSVWSPDGNWLVFGRRITGSLSFTDLYRSAATGTGTVEIVAKDPAYESPSDWSSDGRYLLYEHSEPSASQSDTWVLSLRDKSKHSYLNSKFKENLAQFSPNVRWVAYQSDESGRFEINIQSFPEPGRSLPVSTNGGIQPRWRRDGQELYYIASDEKMMAVSIRSEGQSLEIGKPQPLFQTRILDGFASPAYRHHEYAVTRDGQGFLVNETANASTPITIVLNWNAGKSR